VERNLVEYPLGANRTLVEPDFGRTTLVEYIPANPDFGRKDFGRKEFDRIQLRTSGPW
jgi:hypothetical protein